MKNALIVPPVSFRAAERILYPLIAAVTSGRRRGHAAPNAMVLGPAGTGKTSLVLGVAYRAGMKSHVILHADQFDTGDLALPTDTGLGSTTFLPPIHLLALTVEHDRPGVAEAWRHRQRSGVVGGDPAQGPTLLVLDDFANGNAAQQTMLHALLLDRTLGATGIPLRDDVMVVATGNLSGRGYAAHDLTVPVRSRISSVLTIRPDAPEWLSWARGRSLSPLVRAFVAMHPDMLHRPYVDGDANEANPRTWEALAGLIDLWHGLDTDTLLTAVTGVVGTAAATEFVAFMRDGVRAPSPEEIVDDPEHADACADRPDAAFVAVENALVAARRDAAVLDRVLRFVVRLDPQFRARARDLLLNADGDTAEAIRVGTATSSLLPALFEGEVARRKEDLAIERSHRMLS